MAFVKYLIGLLYLFVPSIALAQIELLQPLGSQGSIPINTPNTLPIFVYFNDALEWVYMVAVGFCLIWIVKSGSDIILAGNDSNAAAAKEKMKTVIIAILVLTFAGFILRTLNGLFFV